MKTTNKFVFFTLGVLFLGLVVGVIIVLGAGSTQGPAFYGMVEPELGIAVDGNFVVVDVLSNSPAEKAGVQRGDVLKKVGKQDMVVPSAMKKLTDTEIKSAMGEIPDANGGTRVKYQAVPIIVGRGAGRLTIAITPASPPFTAINTSALKGPLPTPTAAPEGLTYL
jgi:hypothetical protein